MTQKEKDLLLKDLCARVPYGVKIYLEDFPKATLMGAVNGDIILHCNKYDYTYDTPWDIEYIKPYLFPISSITDGQKEEYRKVCDLDMTILENRPMKGEPFPAMFNSQDWLDAHHFDYRGLIEKGLAIDATGKDIY